MRLPCCSTSGKLGSMELRHYDHDGRARFITFCTHHKLPILTNDRFRRIVRDCLAEIVSRFQLKLLAWVIMPEHVHVVVVPPEEIKLGPVIGEMKRLSARKIHRLLESRSSHLLSKLRAIRNGRERFVLWQRRCYDHNCRTVDAVRSRIDYCHKNPVMRGLVKHPEDWRWSSYRSYTWGAESVLEP